MCILCCVYAYVHISVCAMHACVYDYMCVYVHNYYNYVASYSIRASRYACACVIHN